MIGLMQLNHSECKLRLRGLESSNAQRKVVQDRPGSGETSQHPARQCPPGHEMELKEVRKDSSQDVVKDLSAYYRFLVNNQQPAVSEVVLTDAPRSTPGNSSSPVAKGVGKG